MRGLKDRFWVAKLLNCSGNSTQASSLVPPLYLDQTKRPYVPYIPALPLLFCGDMMSMMMVIRKTTQNSSRDPPVMSAGHPQTVTPVDCNQCPLNLPTFKVFSFTQCQDLILYWRL